MAITDDTTLKSYFETGDTPTQAEFEDLVESKSHILTSINEQTGTSYTLELTDIDKTVKFTSNDTGGIDLIVPEEGTGGVAFPIGTVINWVQYGLNQITISGAGSVVVNSADGKDKSRVQYSAGSLIKVDSDEWLLAGDITT